MSIYKKPKLIAADIDGTIANDAHVLSEHTREVYEELHRRGILLGIASGRPLEKWMIKKYEDWGLSFDFDFIIGLNGGQIWEKEEDRVESFSILKKETVKKICDIMSVFQGRLTLQVYKNGKVQCEKIDDLTEASAARNMFDLEVVPLEVMTMDDQLKLMYRGDEETIAEAAEYAKQFHCKEFHSFKTQTTMLEFQEPGADKGKTLKRYCEKHHISLEDVWAFGDMTNDNGLLETAGFGVCMKNGTPDTKAAADVITEYTNEEDGFARFIETYLFDKQ